LADKEKPSVESQSRAKARLREGILVLLVCLALYLLLALISYHRTDPGWSTTGSRDFVQNAGGRVGAWIADFILYLVGYTAYLLPFAIAGLAWVVFRRHRQEKSEEEAQEVHKGLIWLRFIGFLIALSATTTLLDLGFPGARSGVPLASGGVVGEMIAPGLSSTFNIIGAWLISVTLLLFGLTLWFGISWFDLLHWAADTLRAGMGSAWQWQKDRREAKRLRAEELKRFEQFMPKKPEPKAPVSEPKAEKPAKIKRVKLKKAGQSDIDLSADNHKRLPPITLLDQVKAEKQYGYSAEELKSLSEQVEARLKEFGIEAEVVGAYPGPVVTRFEINLAPGMKVSKITTLSKDLARSLSKMSVRVVEVIPGKSYIGLEIPNEDREVVRLYDVLNTKAYKQANSHLTLALGKDISGESIMADVAKMPHLLVAGTTGAGKSVSINAMILSLLFEATPDDVRMIMIDPKMLELSVYEGIPHLLTPVVTDMKEAANALRWCVAEMDRRYRLMSAMSVRNLASFNQKMHEAQKAGETIPNPLVPEEMADSVPHLKPMPQIVVIIDELADMMMVVGKKVEELIARIAQKARAAGIHMILATQRPSVDVITGLIKANIPARIAFQVSQRVDSRTILDQQGAEQLLGHGDMLFLPPGKSVPMRIHGAFVDDDEVLRVVEAWKKRGAPEYIDEILQGDDEGGNADGILSGENPEADPLYDQAVQIVIESRRASISFVQRRLKIGYNRAANLLEAMESAGLVSEMGSNGQREVLLPEQN